LPDYYHGEGILEKALEIYQEELADMDGVFGKNHRLTIHKRKIVAKMLVVLGKWKETEQLEAQVMEVCIEKLGKKHPETLTRRPNLALIYLEQGRWEESEQLLEKSREVYKKVFGKKYPYMLSDREDSVSESWKRRHLKETEQLIRRKGSGGLFAPFWTRLSLDWVSPWGKYETEDSMA